MSNTELPTYTIAELAMRNSRDKEEIWCAYKGLIYEVTKSKLWRHGQHYQNWAGQDLTSEFGDAPHTENVFDKFDVVGRIPI